MGTAGEINLTFDLLSLAGQDTDLKRSGSCWWAGPCPFCGGVDRFTLKQTEAGWRWFCRHCGGDRYHTPLDYIMQRQACSFQDAVSWIKGSSRDRTARAEVVVPAAPDSPRPDPAWQARSLAYLGACEAALWGEPGIPALSWLRARGLKDGTIRRYRLGYNPQDAYEPLSGWGLPEPEDGRRHAVWLPRGIVIPCWEESQLWYLKIRRPLSRAQLRQGGQKYIKVKGGKPGLFGAWNLRGAWLIVLTEGELDCMLLNQQAADLAGIATLGSASDRISRLDLSIWGKWLLQAAYILVAYDLDEPGEKGLRALAGFSERVLRAPLPGIPGVKDITDYHRTGADISEWLVRTVEKLGIL